MSSITVSQLFIYPIKALGGFSPSTAVLAGRGFIDDRRWMLVDTRGRFISQRQHAQLTLWTVRVEGDELILQHRINKQEVCIGNARTTEGPRVDVQVWDNDFSAYLIEHATEPLTAALGLVCRLVYMSANVHRPVDPRYAKAGEEVSFADGYPYLITNTASLEELSSRYGEQLWMNRFRPNIVLQTDTPFAEDKWARLRIGGADFRLPKPCARCNVTTINQETATITPRVFAELAAFRKVGRKVLFGMNACYEGAEGQTIAVGEAVEIVETVTAMNTQ